MDAVHVLVILSLTVLGLACLAAVAYFIVVWARRASAGGGAQVPESTPIQEHVSRGRACNWRAARAVDCTFQQVTVVGVAPVGEGVEPALPAGVQFGFQVVGTPTQAYVAAPQAVATEGVVFEVTNGTNVGQALQVPDPQGGDAFGTYLAATGSQVFAWLSSGQVWSIGQNPLRQLEVPSVATRTIDGLVARSPHLVANWFLNSTPSTRGGFEWHEFGTTDEHKAWSYYVRLDDLENVRAFGSNVEMLTQSSGLTTLRQYTQTNPDLPGTVWTFQTLILDPGLVPVLTWGDQVAVAECGLFACVQGTIAGSLPIVTHMYRDSITDPWLASSTYLNELSPNSGFGASMAMSATGAVVVIGSPTATEAGQANRGRADVYVRDASNGLVHVQELAPKASLVSNAGLFFGHQVLVNAEGTTVLVAGYGTSISGYVQVFTLTLDPV